ncbi:MAG TPA: hypothetical protein VK206_21655 [Anaerolineales bacterium]|nr:hypothetical protein [Anaerolineales bacterium]
MKQISLFSTVCLIAILITACGQAQATKPPISKPEPTRVEFQASDGYNLVGYYYPSPLPNAPTIVLMHMWRTTQQEWVRLGLVDWLQNWPVNASSEDTLAPAQMSIYPPMPNGVAFNVFTFDYRGHGESGPEIDFYSLKVEQVDQLLASWLLDSKAAYEKAKTLPGVDPTRVAGIGASLGGNGVVYACGETCLGALLLSPGEFPNLPYKDVVKTLDDAGKPVWCIAQEKDQFKSAETCQSASGAHYKSIIYPEDKGEYGLHGMALLLPDVAPPNIGQHILDFLLLVFKSDQ